MSKQAASSAEMPAPPSVSPATNIFQMDFHVNDVQLWQLPNGGDCIDTDPTGIEFRYLDKVHVRIDHDECRKGTGQNCMFTLATQPAVDDGPIRIEVFKRPLCPGEQISVGTGEIAIDAAFEKIFREIGEDAVPSFPKSDVYKAWYPLQAMIRPTPPAPAVTDDGVDAAAVADAAPVAPVADAADVADVAAIPDATTAVTDVADPAVIAEVVELPEPVPVHVGVVCVRLRLTCFGPMIVMPSGPMKKRKCEIIVPDKQQRQQQLEQQQQEQQTDDHIPCDKIFECVCPATVCAAIGSRKRRRNNNRQNQHNSEGRPNDICSDCALSLKSGQIDCEPFTDDEIIINNDTLSYCCNDTGDEVESGPEPPDSFRPPAVPPASKTDIRAQSPGGTSDDQLKRRRPAAFDEYRTEFDENTLIVRVAKNARKVCRLVDGGAGDIEAMQLAPPGPNEMPICVGAKPTIGGLDLNFDLNQKRRSGSPSRYQMTCTQDGNDMNFQVPNAHHQFKFINTYGLPLIRGNRKYPAGFETNFRMPACQPVVDEPVDNGEMADVSVAEGIEVSKRPNCDPKFDVFVLKLAPLSSCADDYVELELHTPKSPAVKPQCLPNEAQTIEEEFALAYSAEGNKLGAGGRGGKGDKKKSKEKEAKGDKKEKTKETKSKKK